MGDIKTIKVMHYTRQFWFGVRCAWLVQCWHTLLLALGFLGEICGSKRTYRAF